MKNKSEVNHNSLEYPTISHFWLYLHFWIFSKHSETCRVWRVKTMCQKFWMVFLSNLYPFFTKISFTYVTFSLNHNKYWHSRTKIDKKERNTNNEEFFRNDTQCLGSFWFKNLWPSSLLLLSTFQFKTEQE